jgi:hypothetical protein
MALQTGLVVKILIHRKRKDFLLTQRSFAGMCVNGFEKVDSPNVASEPSFQR